jgi:hypothetical protein
MNRDKFIEYLESPEKLSGENADDIRGVLQEYPYFQTAHMLLVKALNNLQDLKFRSQLKVSAAHIGNRHILFNLVHRQQFTAKPSAEPEKIHDTDKTGPRQHPGPVQHTPAINASGSIIPDGNETTDRVSGPEETEPSSFEHISGSVAHAGEPIGQITGNELNP